VYHVCQSLEDDPVRGTRGPYLIIQASKHEIGKNQKAFLNGAHPCGFALILDLNASGPEGAGPSPVCRQSGDRAIAANSSIRPIRHLPNLSILSESLMGRIAFSDNRVTGILLANRRHILATQSHPERRCYHLSRIPPALCNRAAPAPPPISILPLVDISVGLSAYGHPCIPIVSKPRPGSYDKDNYSLQCRARWPSSLRLAAVDHQLVCFSYLLAEVPDPQVQQQSLAGVSSGHVAGVGCNLNEPTSSGNITITSYNSNDIPAVVPN
jgi:choline dehydrogenase